MKSYGESDVEAISELLIGRKVVKVADDKIRLDNGVELQFIGNEGGCSCGAGDYALTELSDVDNIITNVEFENSPDGDDNPEGDGFYKIFVFADNRRINLATFVGSDGNGYYGTGYEIQVRPAP